MKQDRLKRLSILLQEKISSIILMKLQEPELKFVTITKVFLTADLRQAKIYYSYFGSGGETAKENVAQLLEAYKGKIRKALSEEIRIRHTPSLSFFYDDGLEYSQHISKLFENLKGK